MTESAASPSRHEPGGRPTVVVSTLFRVPPRGVPRPPSSVAGASTSSCRRCRRGRRGDPDRRRRDRHGLRPARRRPCRGPRTGGRDPLLQHRDGQGRRPGGRRGRHPGPKRPRLLHRRGLGSRARPAARRGTPDPAVFDGDAAGGWPNDDRSITGSLRRLRGQTLGIAGAGRIGRLVARQSPGVRLPDHRLRSVHLGQRAIPTCRWSTATSCSPRPTRSSWRAAYTPGAPPLISRRGAGGASSRASSSSTSLVAATSTSTRSPRRCATAGSPSRHSMSARKSRPTPPTIR